MIPQDLIDAADYLKGKTADINALIADTEGRDARVASAILEDGIVDLLQAANRWEVISPNLAGTNNRSWYDCKINDCFCNIKISELKTNDNTNAKMAIYYLLTGQEPIGISDKNKYIFALMKKNESPDKNRDYYYFVVNKADPADIFPVSLRGLAHYVPNPTNQPFQSNWDSCRTPVTRTWQEAKEFLLTQWATSISRNIANETMGMPTSYPEYFED